MKSKVGAIKTFWGIEKSFYKVTNKDIVKNNTLFINTFIKSIIIIPVILFVIIVLLFLILKINLSFIISNNIREEIEFSGAIILTFGLIVEIPLGALIWSLFRIKLDKRSLLKNILSHLYTVMYIVPSIRGIYYGNLWGNKHYSLLWSIPIIIIIIIPILRYIIFYFKSK